MRTATKLLTELHRLANRETPMILGITVAQDVFLALYLALLAPILGQADSALQPALIFGRAFGFLILLLLVARFLAPAMSAGWCTPRMTSFAPCCSSASRSLLPGLAEELGVSDVVGALMIGLILAETRVATRVEHLVLPLRDALQRCSFSPSV